MLSRFSNEDGLFGSRTCSVSMKISQQAVLIRQVWKSDCRIRRRSKSYSNVAGKSELLVATRSITSFEKGSMLVAYPCLSWTSGVVLGMVNQE